MSLPHAVLFDLDDTLAASFEAPDKAMIDRLRRLLEIVPVAIITGRDFDRTEPGFLPILSIGIPRERLFVLAESSSDGYIWDGTVWTEAFSSILTPEERTEIKAAIDASLAKTHVLEGLPCYGERIVEKRGQIAFAMLGLGVPADVKYTWDPQHERRRTLLRELSERLPQFDVFLGGATSIDVTRKGMNKAHGVRWLCEHLHIYAQQMLYIGDALYPGGNDQVVIETGIETKQTSGPAETAHFIDALLVEYVAFAAN